MSREIPTPEEIANIQEAQGADSALDEKGLPHSTEPSEGIAQIQQEQGDDSAFDERGLPRSFNSLVTKGEVSEQPKAEGSVEGRVEQEIAHEEQLLEQNLEEFLPTLEKPNADGGESSLEKWNKASEAYQIMKLKISNYGMSAVSAFTGVAGYALYKQLQADQFMKSIDITQMQKYAELMKQSQDYGEVALGGVLVSLGVIGLAHWYHSRYKNPYKAK